MTGERRRWIVGGGALIGGAAAGGQSLVGALLLWRPDAARAAGPAATDERIRLAQAFEGKPSRAPDVPYVPTRMEVVDRMLDVAKVGPKDRLLDLGCGDGRIVVRAAERFGTHGTGVDIDPQRIRDAEANARRRKVEKITKFELGDVFTYDFSKATVITMYLLPSVNLELKPRLQKEAAPGTRIVSHDFDMGDWKPELSEKVGTSDYVYLWRIPAR